MSLIVWMSALPITIWMPRKPPTGAETPLKSCDCESMSLTVFTLVKPWMTAFIRIEIFHFRKKGWQLRTALYWFPVTLCLWGRTTPGSKPIFDLIQILMKICFHYWFLSITNPNLLLYFLLNSFWNDNIFSYFALFTRMYLNTLKSYLIPVVTKSGWISILIWTG